MLRLSKKIEYGLMAMQFIAARAGTVVPAKEIADKLGISFELLAKVLNLLTKAGLLASHQGIQGGYMMTKPAEAVTVADIISTIEGRQNIVECFHESAPCTCVALHTCTIKSPMQILQERIDRTFKSMTIAEMVHPAPVTILVS